MQMLTPETAMNVLQQSQINDPTTAKVNNKKDMAQVAREFEAVFISEMVKPMFEGIEADDMFGGGKGEEIFRGMMIQEYGKNVADRDATGIQAQVMNKLIEMQSEMTANNQSAAIQSKQILDAEFTETPGINRGSTL
ncbi:MAG: rod-binding protein [Alcanivorax sp.]